MATVARAPVFDPLRQERTRPWVAAHIEGTRGTPATLTVINPPIRQYDWPAPLARATDTTSTRTWLNQNPNVYTNPKPFLQRDWPLAPPPRPYSDVLRTWTNSNINLNTNPFPAGKQTDYAVPPSSRQYSPDLRSWINGSTLFQPALPPIRQYDWPAPQLRPDDRSTTLTWLNQNPNIYTNPVPAGD